MQHDSLFGHLATRFSSHPESIATEALNYVINHSVVARQAFLQYVGQAGVELPDTLSFRTQAVGSDNAIPDLVGTDSESRQVLLVEAKFWAGLTSNQPVAYLKRLPETDGLLLFVAPSRRFETLWPELLRRCQAEGFAIEHPSSDAAREFRAARVGTAGSLALTSWRAVLAYLLRALETEGEHRAASDVEQLQGLCERMDSEAFLPLRSEELTSDTGTRVRQYCEIVNEITRKARAAGIGSTQGVRATAGSGYYLRYLGLWSGLFYSLRFDANLWAKWRATPLWLGFDMNESRRWLHEALASLGHERPSRLIANGNLLCVPLYLPVGAERQEVVSAVFEQVMEVATLLRDYKQSEEEAAEADDSGGPASPGP